MQKLPKFVEILFFAKPFISGQDYYYVRIPKQILCNFNVCYNLHFT